MYLQLSNSLFDYLKGASRLRSLMQADLDKRCEEKHNVMVAQRKRRTKTVLEVRYKNVAATSVADQWLESMKATRNITRSTLQAYVRILKTNIPPGSLQWEALKRINNSATTREAIGRKFVELQVS